MHVVRFDGDRLRDLRLSRKWDQHRLAEAARSQGAGMNQSQVSRYENGQEPSGRNAMALADALGVEVRELFSDDEDEEEGRLPMLTHDQLGLLEVLHRALGRALREAGERTPTGASR